MSPHASEAAHEPSFSPPPTRFRFKGKRERTERQDGLDFSHHSKSRSRHHHSRHHDYHNNDRSPSRSNSPSSFSPSHSQRHDEHHESQRKHMRRHKRRRHSPPDDYKNDTNPPLKPCMNAGDHDNFFHSPLDPDTAFQESLFDALADDEGAAYWEGVYGQPIHMYSNIKTRSNGVGGEEYGHSGDDEKGDLERMTDEEYASYVRARMFEKTHQHIIEERARREEERKRAKEKSRRQRKEMEDERLRKKIEDSLRRGEERKRAGVAWKRAWEGYVSGWEDLATVRKTSSNAGDGKMKGVEGDEEPDGLSRRRTRKETRKLREVIPWPTQSGSWSDVSNEGVEAFFRNVPPAKMDMVALLKAERVRWHPDKVQQRFGGGPDGVDEETMKRVTMVFQIIDHVWDKEKRK